MTNYLTFCEELVSQGIDKKLVDRLVEEYKIAKEAHFSENDESVILHSAKFADVVLAIIKSKVKNQSVDMDKIETKKMVEEIINFPKASAEDVILTLAVPKVIESIHVIRNKKDVAHVKTIAPNEVDSDYCITACDWIFSQLVMILSNREVNQIKMLVDSIMRKKLPLLEEFEDGTALILAPNVTRQEEILLFLYHYYPIRQPNEKLIKLLKSKNNFYAYVNNLENSKLIHRTEQGSTLTKLGIKYVEESLLPKIGA